MRINKKGFTLIELLAVIIVLAIVTLLAVQAVLPQVEKARKNAFVIEANQAIDAAKQWRTTQELESSGTIPSCVTISTLISDGYFEVSNAANYKGSVSFSKSGNVQTYTILMSNGSYQTAETNGHTGKFTTADAKNTSKVNAGVGSNTGKWICS